MPHEQLKLGAFKESFMSAAGAQRALDITQTSKRSKLLQQQFSNKIVGQEKAVQVLIDIFEAHQSGFSDPSKPAGIALFLGPTGCGKTFVCETLAEALLGNKKACIRIDCAEFQHDHEIAKLVGSPHGYLGFRECHPMLEQERLDKYHTEEMKLSILLIDEVEKASDSLWKLLLGILDSASLTLGDNRTVDFSKTIIVLTSNLGAREMANRGIGFAELSDEKDQARLEQIALSAAKSKFSPEFLNRIQHIVTFTALTKEQTDQVLDFELRDLAYRLWVLGTPCSIVLASDLTTTSLKVRPPVPRFEFFVSPSARRFLLKEGFDKAYGARPIKRTIEKYIQKPLAKLVLSEQINKDDKIIIDYKDGTGFEFISQGGPTINDRS